MDLRNRRAIWKEGNVFAGKMERFKTVKVNLGLGKGLNGEWPWACSAYLVFMFIALV